MLLLSEDNPDAFDFKDAWKPDDMAFFNSLSSYELFYLSLRADVEPAVSCFLSPAAAPPVPVRAYEPMVPPTEVSSFLTVLSIFSYCSSFDCILLSIILINNKS